MNIKVLFSILKKKGYHYFDGHTNDRDSDLYIYFSTLHNGRGDSVELRLGDTDHDITIFNNITNREIKNIDDNELFSFIEKLC